MTSSHSSRVYPNEFQPKGALQQPILKRRLSSRVADKFNKAWRGSSIYLKSPRSHENRRNSLVTPCGINPNLMSSKGNSIEDTYEKHGNSSARSRRSFRGVIINFHDSIRSSLRSSFASVDSAITETSAREKGLTNSTEYVPKTGTMSNDAALYIQRAEHAQKREKSSTSRQKGVGCVRNHSNDLSRDTDRQEGIWGQRSSNSIKYRNESSRYESASQPSLGNIQNFYRSSGNFEQASQPRRSLISRIISPRKLNSLCFLVLLLIIGLLAIGTIMGNREDLFNFFGNAFGSTSNNPDILSNAPSTASVSWSNSPTRDLISPNGNDSLPSTAPSSFVTDTHVIGSTKLPGTKETLQPSSTPILTLAPSDIPGNTIESSIPSTSPSETASPSSNPSNYPPISEHPSFGPSRTPSRTPTSAAPITSPSRTPSILPSNWPSLTPSRLPSLSPSRLPSLAPSRSPSLTPSRLPSFTPSRLPSFTPSWMPSNRPSTLPSKIPSIFPTIIPSSGPSKSPSSFPSLVPSQRPTVSPKKTKRARRR